MKLVAQRKMFLIFYFVTASLANNLSHSKANEQWERKSAIQTYSVLDQSVKRTMYIKPSNKKIWKEHFENLNGECSFTFTPELYVNSGLSKLTSSDQNIDGTFINVTLNGTVLSHSHGIMKIRNYRNVTDNIFLPFPIGHLADIATFSRRYVRSINKKLPAQNRSGDLDISVVRHCATPDELENGLNPERYTRLVLVNLVFILQFSYPLYVCTVETYKKIGVKVTARRFWLDTCCGVAEWDINTAKDFFEHKRKVDEDLPINFPCHRPDAIRERIILFAKIMSIFVTLFSPLMLKFIPSQPWRHRHIMPLRPSSDTVAGAASHPMECNGMETDQHFSSSENREVQDDEADAIETKFKSISFRRNKKNRPKELQWITLNSGSVYKFGVSMVAYYLFLFHIRFGPLNILRRIVLVYLCLALTSYMYEVFREFYYYLLQVDFVQHHTLMIQLLKPWLNVSNMTAKRESQMYILILPVFYTVCIILTMSYTFLRPSSICKSLYIKEDTHFLGRVYTSMEDQQEKDGNETDHQKDTDNSWEGLLYRKLLNRILRLFSSHFWRFWWHECICGSNPFRRCGKSLIAHVLFAIMVVFRCIVYLMIFLVYVTPAFSIFHGITRNAFGRTRTKWKWKLLATLNFLSMSVGICLIYMEIFVFTYLFVQVVTFVLIDILRNVDSSLPFLILFASVIMYVDGSFTAIEDEYRMIKGIVFTVAEEITASGEGEKIVCSFSPFPRLLRYAKNRERLQLPQPVFDTICQHCLPLSKCVFRKMISLILSLSLICLIFSVVIQFRIFGSFSKEGDTVISLLTVSLPRLLGLFKSEKAEELKTRQLTVRVESTMKRLIVMIPEQDSIV